jgi:hypothetical protein
MILVALVIGAIVVIAAIRNSHRALGAALMQDVPAFMVWGAAIVAVGAIGFIRPMQPVSRALMALVITVIILRNYKGIIGGFQSAWQTPASGDAPSMSNAATASAVGLDLQAILAGMTGGSAGAGFGGQQDTGFVSA